MIRRRILLTNFRLDGRTGSETHLRDHALEFLRRGHEVMVYSPYLGPLADEIAAAGGEVRSDLGKFTAPPDVVQGNNHLQTMQALLHFRNAPGISFCHDATHWTTRPAVFPRILRQVAVDWNCRERVVRDAGVAAADITVVSNTVDLTRFLPRLPLPAKPARAIIFSNYASPGNYVPTLQRACRRAGLTLDAAGSGMNNPVANPEKVLPGYDVVFGKARCALEALAIGCHVVLCDERGLGPTITPENFDELRGWNFGARVLKEKITPEAVAARLADYDPVVAATLQQRVRTECGLEHSATKLLALHEELIAAFRASPPSREDEIAAMSGYLLTLETTIKRIEDEVELFLDGRMFMPRPISSFIQDTPIVRKTLRGVRALFGR